MVNDVKIENRIGDAIVHRIVRAHREGTAWKCCIVIPLLPGFPFQIDHSDASAVILVFWQCGYCKQTNFRLHSFGLYWNVKIVR